MYTQYYYTQVKALKDKLIACKNYEEFLQFSSSIEPRIAADKRTKLYKEIKSEFWDYLKDMWITWRDEFLAENLHKIQITAEADIANLKVYLDENACVYLKVHNDGTIKYAIIENENDIPSYYDYLTTIEGNNIKIMSHDCYKSFNDNGTLLDQNKYSIYKAGKSLIFLPIK